MTKDELIKRLVAAAIRQAEAVRDTYPWLYTTLEVERLARELKEMGA